MLCDAVLHNVWCTVVYGYILIFLGCSVRRYFGNKSLTGQITRGKVCKDKYQTVNDIGALLLYVCIGGRLAAVQKDAFQAAKGVLLCFIMMPFTVLLVCFRYANTGCFFLTGCYSRINRSAFVLQ